MTLGLLLAACGAATPPAGQTLTYGLTLIPTGFDPHINASAELGIPLSSVYDTLVVRDPVSLDFVPGLADKWEISDGGRIYTFYLHEGVLFHDGQPFNAAAVCANLERIANPDNHSQKAAGMLGSNGNLADCQSPETLTAVVRLREPYAPLLDSLSQVYFGMASPQAFQHWGLADYQFHQVGTGPFIFVEYIPGDHLTIRRNPDYQWGHRLLANPGPAYLETVIFRFYADPATRAVALEAGQAQVMGEVLPQDARRLTEHNRFQLQAVPIPGQPLQIILNANRAPTDDLRVRQALRQAVDRTGLVSSVFGGYSPAANGPLTAVTFGYSAEAAIPPQDTQTAARLLAEAGWIDSNGDAVRDRNGVPLEVNLVYGPFGLMPQAAQLVEANWRALGVNVISTPAASFTALREAQAAGQYHAIAFNFSSSDPDVLRAWFTSNGFYNWSQISNPDLDMLLNQASQLASPQQRQGNYAKAQRLINDLALTIPLRDYVNLNVTSRGVKGLRFSAAGWWPWLVDVKLQP